MQEKTTLNLMPVSLGKFTLNKISRLPLTYTSEIAYDSDMTQIDRYPPWIVGLLYNLADRIERGNKLGE